MISTLANSLKNALNRANLQSLTALLGAIAFGSVVRALTTALRGKKPLAVAAYPYVVQAGAQCLALPDDAKAMSIEYAYARTGTGTQGLLTVDATAATAPAAGHCKVSSSGDLLFNSTDAWTSVDVVYKPEKQDAYESATATVASNVATIPSGAGLATMLMEAESLVGTKTGKFVIVQPGATPITGQAALSLDKTQVVFAAADAVTSCRFKIGVASSVDVDAALEASSPQI